MSRQTHSLTAAAPPALARDAAEAAARSAAAGVRAEWRPFEALRAVGAEWQDLAERAIERNVFYEPAFALPAAETFGRGAGAVLVWSGREPRRLIGLFPARIGRTRYGLGPAVFLGWTHPYAPLGVPLVDRREAAAAIAAWLDLLAARKDMPRVALLPYLPAEGSFAAALRAALAQRGGQSRAFGRHARAMLAPGADRAGYLQRAVSAKKRKELRRQHRRLGDSGGVSTEVSFTPCEMAPALAAFMELEAAGWKGAAGTAAARNPKTRRFMQQAVVGLARRSQARIERLTVGGRPVAAAIVLRSGATAWFWKIAYDEEAARASPGVQLALELTRAALKDASLARIDSCATPDHPMIDRLWRERLALADFLIAPGPGASFAFALASLAEHARRRLIGAARWVRNRLRGRP